MAIFTNTNRIVGDNYAVEPDTSYVGEAGCARALLDTTVNERLLFESLIMQDFEEVYAIKESNSEDEIRAIAEASVSGFLARVKEFLKKVWEKLVGIVMSFIKFIQANLIRDNKALVKKYDLDIRKKDLSKMKYKWADAKSGAQKAFSEQEKTNAEKFCQKAHDTLSDIVKNVSSVSEKIEKVKDKDNKEKALKAVFNDTKNEIEWDNSLDTIWNVYYDDPDDKEGLGSALYEDIKKELEDAKTTLDSFNKLKINIDKHYKEKIKEIDNAMKDTNMDDTELDQKKVESAIFQSAQEVSNKAIGGLINNHKRRTKQCRALFIKAASYRGVNENAVLTEAMIDVDGQHVDEMFERGYTE